eukprot:TRINITY_DN15144_c0_g1_i5.p2 TRINITY_DN15144_c0_g1~~TRINITY_DN15144_c0_g1_i5.p2  ORF type:complete len:118 (+),score=7.18 TRINITY_DN15144_c0_g1_i5:283-636(+)
MGNAPGQKGAWPYPMDCCGSDDKDVSEGVTEPPRRRDRKNSRLDDQHRPLAKQAMEQHAAAAAEDNPKHPDAVRGNATGGKRTCRDQLTQVDEKRQQRESSGIHPGSHPNPNAQSEP